MFHQEASVETIKLIILLDYPIKKLLADAKLLQQHLKAKLPPIERDQYHEIYDKFYNKVLHKMKKVKIDDEDEERLLKDNINNKVTHLMRTKVYNWKSVNFNLYNSLVYLYARSAPEYAVMMKIFSEISMRDPTFKPRALFDFGSGMGSVTW